MDNLCGAIWEWLRKFVSDPNAFFAAAVALFTYFMWKVSRRQAQSMVLADRAFVSIKGFKYLSHKDPTGKVFWSIHPVLENSGNTPTKTAFINVTYRVRADALPPEFDFPDHDSKRVPTLIAPHTSVVAVEGTVSGDELVEVQKRMKHLYIWGWAEYRDIFPSSKMHITRFCYEVTNIRGNPAQAFESSHNAVEMTFSVHETNNCMDDGCDKP